MSDVVNNVFSHSGHEGSFSSGYLGVSPTAPAVEDDRSSLSESVDTQVIKVVQTEEADRNDDGTHDSTDDGVADGAAASAVNQENPADSGETPTAFPAEAAASNSETHVGPSEAATETATKPVAEPASAPNAEPAGAPVMGETQPSGQERGNTTVADEVVEKVVNMLVRKADGVHALDEAGISVAIQDGVATIGVPLVIEFGHAVKAIADEIRNSIIDAVEGLLGLTVATVNVHVTDIRLPDAE